MTLPGLFAQRGLHAVELAAGERVHGNISGDPDVRKKNEVCHHFRPVLLLYSFIKSLHRRFLCRQCRLKALAAVYVLVSLRRKISIKLTFVIL